MKLLTDFDTIPMNISKEQWNNWWMILIHQTNTLQSWTDLKLCVVLYFGTMFLWPELFREFFCLQYEHSKKIGRYLISVGGLNSEEILFPTDFNNYRSAELKYVAEIMAEAEASKLFKMLPPGLSELVGSFAFIQEWDLVMRCSQLNPLSKCIYTGYSECQKIISKIKLCIYFRNWIGVIRASRTPPPHFGGGVLARHPPNWGDAKWYLGECWGGGVPAEPALTQWGSAVWKIVQKYEIFLKQIAIFLHFS